MTEQKKKVIVIGDDDYDKKGYKKKYTFLYFRGQKRF